MIRFVLFDLDATGFEFSLQQMSLPLIQNVIQIALSVGETNGSFGPAAR
jgi:hypothetical protein